MSKTLELDIDCPRCQTSFRATLYRTIWVEFPENMNLIESDQINLVHCPACGLTEMPPFPFLATNVKKKIAIWYEPIPDPNIDGDIALYARHFGADNFFAAAQRVEDWEEFKSRLAQLNKLPDVLSTMEDLNLFKLGMQSANSHSKEATSKSLTKAKGLAKLIESLQEAEHKIPNSVAEIPNFPCSTFAVLKESVSQKKLTFYCPTLSYSSDIFTLLANRSESLRFFIATFMICLVPIISIVLAVVLSWRWAFLCLLAIFVGWKLGKSTYMKTVLRSAAESEKKFCFLFYSYKIGGAVLPDMAEVYVWQGPYPSSS